MFTWIKNNIFVVTFFIVFIIFTIFTVHKFNKLESFIQLYVKYYSDQYITPYSTNLDFQNKSGVDRIHSSFTDVLIGSAGSIKKGNGYILKLQIINPSFIKLVSINCYFKYSNSEFPVNYTDPNLSILPGNSKIIECFISDLPDSDLKLINVSVTFDQIQFH